MIQRYYLGHIPDEQWHVVLGHFLEQADSFAVHVPDGPGPLSHGREEFSALPEVTVGPWSGMRDAIEIAGALSGRPREMFAAMETSLESFNPEEKLWDYRLLKKGEVILSIGDYIDLLIYAGPDDVAMLEARGLDSTGWDPC